MASEFRARVDAALRDFVDDALGELATIGGDLVPVAGAAREFVLGGGKRLRPAFCFWAARAVGMPDSEALVAAASSLELLQACALVHDDVIDRSATRRGQPAVHERFAAHHRGEGWSGGAEDFGAATAILLGDLFLVWSDAMLATSGVDAAALSRARPVIDSMRVEVMAGQYLDIVEQARGGGSVERALRVARFKAAKYTVERPSHLGVALGGGDQAAYECFTAYGVPLGEAFQLRDDLLGVFGDPATTGKPAGDDLREGKRTVLVALAMQAASPADRDELTRHIGDATLDDAGVEQLRRIISASGAAAQVEGLIAERVRAAQAALDAADLASEATDALRSLVDAATQRVG
jgi:geranylgeranyl diphosphate synthase type I